MLAIYLAELPAGGCDDDGKTELRPRDKLLAVAI